MIDEHYPLSVSDDRAYFLFESHGPKGAILKIIVFSQYRGVLWNLAFGDYLDGRIQDGIISNNHDLRKTISTVAQAVYLFHEAYPDRPIFIKPVDDRRKMLYNEIFRRKSAEIQENYLIFGRTARKKKEVYNPNKIYDTFELHFKC